MSQRIIDRSYVGDVLQQMYTSELDIKVTLITRSGYFYAESADKKISLQGTTIEEAVTHLAVKLAQEFPGSNFAGWWVSNFKQSS
jgi:hypothetical protein